MDFFNSFTFIVAVALVGAVAYVIAYNWNANKALRSGKANVLLDKGPFLQLVALAGLVVLSIILLIQMSNIKTTINDLKNKISDLQTQVNWLNGNLNSLRSEFNQFSEEQKNVYDTSYTFLSVDAEMATIETRIRFSLREVGANSKIYVKASNKNNSDEVQILAEGIGNYATTIDLSIYGNYTFIIIEDTETTIKTFKLFDIYIKNLTENRYKVQFDIIDRDKHIINIAGSHPIDFEEFKLNDVTLEIKKADNTIVYSGSIFKDLTIQDNLLHYQVRKDYFNPATTYYIKITLYNEFGIAHVAEFAY